MKTIQPENVIDLNYLKAKIKLFFIHLFIYSFFVNKVKVNCTRKVNVHKNISIVLDGVLK